MTAATGPIAPVHLVTGREADPSAHTAADVSPAWTAAAAVACIAFAAAAAWFIRWSRERVLPAEERAFRRMARGLRLRRRERQIVTQLAAVHAATPPPVAVLVSREAFDAGAAVARAGGKAAEVELRRIREKVFGAA